MKTMSKDETYTNAIQTVRGMADPFCGWQDSISEEDRQKLQIVINRLDLLERQISKLRVFFHGIFESRIDEGK